MPIVKKHLPMPVASLSLSDDTTRSQVVDQLLAAYRKASSAGERIAEANLDLVLFGGMLAQIESAIAELGAPKRGIGAMGLNSWLEAYVPEIDRRRAGELKALAKKIAEEYSLEVGELRGLLTAADDAELPTGASTKRRKILEALGAGSIHRLHMQFGSRGHGGARTPAPRPQLTAEQVRTQRATELGKLTQSITHMLFVEDEYIWFEPATLEHAAAALQRCADQARTTAAAMRSADAKEQRKTRSA